METEQEMVTPETGARGRPHGQGDPGRSQVEEARGAFSVEVGGAHACGEGWVGLGCGEWKVVLCFWSGKPCPALPVPTKVKAGLEL